MMMLMMLAMVLRDIELTVSSVDGRDVHAYMNSSCKCLQNYTISCTNMTGRQNLVLKVKNLLKQSPAQRGNFATYYKIKQIR